MSYIIAVAVGLVFGAADQYLASRSALGAWAWTVSGMSAPWLVLPFVVGMTQERRRRAMVLGVVATMAALVGYFAMTDSPMENVPLDRFFSGVLTMARTGYNPLWIVGGLVIGPLYGFLGHRWRVARPWVSARARHLRALLGASGTPRCWDALAARPRLGRRDRDRSRRRGVGRLRHRGVPTRT